MMLKNFSTWQQFIVTMHASSFDFSQMFRGVYIYAKFCMENMSLESVSSFSISGKLWIDCKGKKFFGPGPAELLERIEKTGSINQAAKEMNMSYKKAWELINTLNANSAEPLVITQSGGEKGGGSVITEEAKRWLTYHQQLRERFKAFLNNETHALMNLRY